MQASDHSVRLSDGLVMEFQTIPAGLFRMGSRGSDSDEEPPHVVRITEPFYLGTYPVTQGELAVWTREAGIAHANHFKDKPDHPSENMKWDEAMAFCAWLNTARRSELPLGHIATLPTEAQWEHACRGGTETEYNTGDGEAALADAGWFGQEWTTGSTHPVGLKTPNQFQLRDMHGNVWEWCLDAWDADAYKKRVHGIADPEVRAADVGNDNPDRVVRGGSWFGSARNCGSARRYWWRPGSRVRNQGFRVCLVPGPVPEQTSETEVEPATGDGARRDAEAESEGARVAGVERPDSSRATFSPRGRRQGVS